MNLCRCEKGHFYDKEKYSKCPHCNGTALLLEEALSPPDIKSIAPPTPVLPAPPVRPENNWDSKTTVYPFLDFSGSRQVEDIEKRKEGAIELSTRVCEVELFRSMGQIRRKGTFRPTETCSRVFILELPGALREDSIHFMAEQGLVVRKMGVIRYQSTYNKEIGKITKEIEELMENLRPLADKLQICELKLKSIRRYIKAQSRKAADHPDFWQNISSAEKEWDALTTERNEYQRRIKEILDRNFELEKERTKWECRKREVHGLELELEAEPDREYHFSLDYIVDHVGWTPRYDIRTYMTGTEMQLILHADISQDSGEDWDQVQMKLSTEQDLPAADAAIISPQKISLVEGLTESDIIPSASTGMLTSDDDFTVSMAPAFTEEITPTKMTLAEEAVASEKSNPIQRQYAIEDAVSMKNNSSCTLVLTSKTLQVKKRFFSIPKKECSQYMGVFADEFKNEKLLDCSVRVYVDDVYSTMLRTDHLTESGIIVLGRAHGVSLQRRVCRDEESNKRLSGQKEICRSYEIEIENEMDGNASLLVIDQIPVSHHAAITVSNVKIGDGVMDEAGICQWDVTLQPHEKVVLPVEYVVTYPQKEKLKWE